MTTKTKAANYTAEMVATITSVYTSTKGDNTAKVAAAAKAVGKTVPSVRAKLSAEKVYVKAQAAKGTSTKESKQDIADAIAKVAGLSEAEAEGLAKATKAPLERILKQLTNG